MNEGVHLQSLLSPLQHMMAGNPNLWNVNNTMRPQLSPLWHTSSSNLLLHYPLATSSSSSLPIPSWLDNDNQEQLPESWSQLLMGGMVGEDQDNGGLMNYIPGKRVENNWEEKMQEQSPDASVVLDHHPQHHNRHHDVKREDSSSSPPSNCNLCGHLEANIKDDYLGRTNKSPPLSHHPAIPASPPKSCVTTSFNSSSILDFSDNKSNGRHQPPDRSNSECNSNATGGAQKKAKVQPSTTSQSNNFKVRKEKLGDRISTLHQLVSPFGKTDTASVLLEAIGYIRFLQNQIEALSIPYLGNGASRNTLHQQSHCDKEEAAKMDLKSRGLCLVPVACTLQVGSDNGADYWASAFGVGSSLRSNLNI